MAATHKPLDGCSAQHPVFYEDEVDSHLNPKIGADWQLRGQQKRVITPGQNEAIQRLETVPGIGPLGASALLTALGDSRDFHNGRHFSSYLGLVPKEHSSGGKVRLFGITKRGDGYHSMGPGHSHAMELMRPESADHHQGS